MRDQHPFPWDPHDPAFPWEAGLVTAMSTFLDACTLHDSYFACRLHFETYGWHVGDAFAEVVWDKFWIGEQCAAAGTPLERGPTLFIRFPETCRVQSIAGDVCEAGNSWK